MAYAPNTAHGQIQTKAAAAWTHLRDSLQHYLARRAIYQRTLRELHALSNRELADLGIHRSEIARIAQDSTKNA